MRKLISNYKQRLVIGPRQAPFGTDPVRRCEFYDLGAGAPKHPNCARKPNEAKTVRYNAASNFFQISPSSPFPPPLSLPPLLLIPDRWYETICNILGITPLPIDLLFSRSLKPFGQIQTRSTKPFKNMSENRNIPICLFCSSRLVQPAPPQPPRRDSDR